MHERLDEQIIPVISSITIISYSKDLVITEIKSTNQYLFEVIGIELKADKCWIYLKTEKRSMFINYYLLKSLIYFSTSLAIKNQPSVNLDTSSYSVPIIRSYRVT